jgi:serine O-acetyltransferase
LELQSGAMGRHELSKHQPFLGRAEELPPEPSPTRAETSGRSRFLDDMRADWEANQPRPLARPGFHALAVYRFSRAVEDIRGPKRLPLKLLRSGLQYLVQTLYSVELPWQAQVGRRLVIGHLGGSVISPDAVIGDECLIRQNVTIGAARPGGRSPRIGRGVEIGAGAVVLGDISIGDGAIIGPNCVVVTDVPASARVVAAPSRILAGPAVSGPLAVEDAADGANDGRIDAVSIAALIRDALDIETNVDSDTALLSSGLIDSLNLVLAMEVLESTYGVTVPSEDVDAESFDTPLQIAEYLRARLT